ncbi:anti-sigma factor RsbA family regulatory protein [Actinosynnema sp. CA-299493]
MTTLEAPSSAGFTHPAFFYASDEEYVETLVPFVLDGLAAGQPVAVAVPGARMRLLRDALGDAAAHVRMLDMRVAGRNPGRIIPAVLRRFADTHVSGHVRIVGEPIWADRTDAEYPACAQHEALINLAFAGRDATILCPYDTSSLDPHVLDDALLTHPAVWHGAHRGASDRYDPDAIVGRYNRPFDVAPRTAGFPVTATADIRGARGFAVARAQRLGLAAERVADLELIATELVTNGLRHTGAGCLLRIWHDNGHVVCAVEDSGHLADPLAGRRPPAPGQAGGRGLLLVNQLADLVRTHTSPHGTTVYAFLNLVAAGRDTGDGSGRA